MKAMLRQLPRPSMVTTFFFVLVVGVFICTRYLDSVVLMDINFPAKSLLSTEIRVRDSSPETSQNLQSTPPKKYLEIPLNCSLGNQSRSCPANYYPSNFVDEDKDRSLMPPPSCPDYFRWIHDDLWPWRETGITREMVMMGKPSANFRLVIVDGKAYVEKYKSSYQTRDIFTQWSILQLLRRYPGKLPDLDLMFDCNDFPFFKKETFACPGCSAPPPTFRYCDNSSTFSILFPDWSFWGWPETNIKPWEQLSEELKEANEKIRWTEREPYAYWKGTPQVSRSRMDLLKCNVSDEHDWNARVYTQNWGHEVTHSFKNSDLANQCIHRYKIYIEGCSWSVSGKYIMACDSVTLFVKPNYYDFFTRNLMPLKHYWPIKYNDKCRSIQYAVDRGNRNQEEAQAIGKAGSRFILDELKMDHIYDYMFHTLSEYAKLLMYKPTVPSRAVEICSESIVCSAEELVKKFLMDSRVKAPASSEPCTMPPPHGPTSFHSRFETKYAQIRQVDAWEKEYWQAES